MKFSMKDKINRLKSIKDTQYKTGNWDYSQYMRGMANGLEVAYSIINDTIPIFKDDIPRYLSEMTRIEKMIYRNEMLTKKK